MTDYPYSQQIHDKILNDWKDIPFDEWKFLGYVISHPNVPYDLYYYPNQGIRPDATSLWDNISSEHRDSLYEKLMKKPSKIKQDQEKEKTAKQFLGLN